MPSDLEQSSTGDEYFSQEACEPIDWEKDDDAVLVRKINARISDTRNITTKKNKEYKEADAYLDGEPQRIDAKKRTSINNHLLPIIRNMTGLITDSRPHPGVKLVRLKKDFPQDVVKQLLETGDLLERDLNNWWDDSEMQSRLQRIVFSQQVYADFFIMPYFSKRKNDVCIELLHPNRVRIDTNASELDDADFATVDFFRSRQWMYREYTKEKCKDIVFMDYSEAQVYETVGAEMDTEYKMMKNVAKLELYMEPEWWAYKCGDKLMKKMRNPLWVPDEETQKADTKGRIEKKYKKGFVGETVDKVKGAIGMENDGDKLLQEVEAAMAAFKPKANFFNWPKIPLVQFDTYRMAGEMYSRSLVKQAIKTIDNINDRQDAIASNSKSLGKPSVFVDGSILDEEETKKLVPKELSNKAHLVRVKTDGQKSVQSSVVIQQGTPMPAQYFEDMKNSEHALDNLFGHHEVSKGAGDPSSRTKGGILALQEADQTPIRYLTRNLEDSLQELFNWVVQIRKIYRSGKSSVEIADKVEYIDYDDINDGFRIFLKSGSMMPVSREAQRADALDMYRSNALDPLSLFERLDDPDPERTAKRLQAWLAEKQILDDGSEKAMNEVVEKIILIKQNRFQEVVPKPDDDPQVHHDMLLTMLKTNSLTPEQEQFTAQLIQQYITMLEGPANQAPGGAPVAPTAAPAQPQPPIAAPSTTPMQ